MSLKKRWRRAIIGATAAGCAALASPAASQPIAEPVRSKAQSRSFTVEQIVGRALANSPSVAGGRASIAAARAGRLQASVRPVDQIEVDAENIAGTGGVLNQTEITGLYARTLERGGKRSARIALADREIGVAEAAALVRRLEIAASVERAFADALIADARLEAALNQLDIERSLSAEAERRVRGYKDPLFVRTRAQARVAEAEIGVARVRRVRESVYASLSALAGLPAGELRLDSAGFLDAVPGAAGALADADLALAAAEVARAEAAIGLERTRATGDYTVRGGLIYLRESDDLGLVGGITIPLGAGRANRGNVERARAERDRVAFDAEATRLERLRRVASLQGTAEGARLEATSISDDVLPRLARALAQVREGYARGGFSFADIQDQARALFEARGRLVDALERHHAARVELDRLTGRFVNLEIDR